ncbi:MAG: aldo/keto reductase [Conexivisphaerales archaeon]
MEKRTFGRTGENVSVIGMGTWYDSSYIATAKLTGKGSGFQQKVAGLRRGIELGMNFIDTAEMYMSEPVVAEAIKGENRDDLFIATKVWTDHMKYDDVLKAAERSRERLGLKYIDLYQIHWPNPSVPLKETLRAMEKLVYDGTVRYIGVCNFSVELLEEAKECLAKVELVSDQIEYNLTHRGVERDILPYCEQNNLAVIAYRPVAHGSLANPRGRLKEAMDVVSKKYNKTYSQIAINWLKVKSDKVIPIPRISNAERAEEDAGAAGWSLQPDDMQYLEDAASQ